MPSVSASSGIELLMLIPITSLVSPKRSSSPAAQGLRGLLAENLLVAAGETAEVREPPARREVGHVAAIPALQELLADRLHPDCPKTGYRGGALESAESL